MDRRGGRREGVKQEQADEAGGGLFRVHSGGLTVLGPLREKTKRLYEILTTIIRKNPAVCSFFVATLLCVRGA